MLQLNSIAVVLLLVVMMEHPLPSKNFGPCISPHLGHYGTCRSFQWEQMSGQKLRPWLWTGETLAKYKSFQIMCFGINELIIFHRQITTRILNVDKVQVPKELQVLQKTRLSSKPWVNIGDTGSKIMTHYSRGLIYIQEEMMNNTTD